jgi:branched-chain amino acid aminotransferase
MMAMSSPDVPDSLADAVVCVDGELRPPDEPHVFAYDRGLLYADGVYDSLPVYDGRALFVDRHVDRLFRSLAAARIDGPFSKAEIREWIVDTLEASGVAYGGCRIVVTRGVGRQGMRNAPELGDPTVLVIPTPRSRAEMAYGRPTTETARIVSTRTVPADSIDPKLKATSYLENVLAERELAGTDATAGIMLDHEGRVAEAFDANVFVVDDAGTVKTPGTETSLAGVTRSVVLSVARELNYEPVVCDLTPAELYSARDVFLTGSGLGVSHVDELNGQSLGEPGETATAIAERFRAVSTEREYVDLDLDR